MYKIAITNRQLCNDLLARLRALQGYRYIILREKDLSPAEYTALARQAISICDNIILHTFIDTAFCLNYRKIHLPYLAFVQNVDVLGGFELVGVSVHSLDEALTCQSLGANYVTYSPVFATDCKKDVPPKGLAALKEVCDNVSIDVYALGGINEDNAAECIKAGASGVCMMSGAMKQSV